MIVTYLVVGISHCHRYSSEWNSLFQYLFYPYFTHFKELLSPILNFLIFLGENGAATHLLKIFKNVPVVIAYNFQKQNYCKFSRQFSPSVVFVHILRQKDW